ncbi:MAG: class I SAM-dependent methyltransferase [Candidatus Omnitrophota bacterium]
MSLKRWRFKDFLINHGLIITYIRFILRGYRKYFNIFTHLRKKERLLLYKLALSLKKNSIIVEIGSYLGSSAAFLACAAKDRGHMVYCVDTWKNEGMSEGSRDTFAEFCINIASIQSYIRILRGNSAEIARTFDRGIDLLFIDGNHSYDGVKQDVELWLPKLKDNGIIIFHDVAWEEGVQKVINEYIQPIVEERAILANTYWAKVKK